MVTTSQAHKYTGDRLFFKIFKDKKFWLSTNYLTCFRLEKIYMHNLHNISLYLISRKYGQIKNAGQFTSLVHSFFFLGKQVKTLKQDV